MRRSSPKFAPTLTIGCAVSLLTPRDSDLEALANYFYDTGQIIDTFIRQLVPNDLTHAAPNVGHFAIADMIITKSCHFIISTNFDDLIEIAVAQIGERAFYSSLDGMEAENEARHSVPLLKIHGCWRKNREHTIWTPRQLAMDVIRLRLENSKRWLHARLQNRDLLFLGFFTDWEYLNTVLQECLPQYEPRSVVVVDPTELNSLKDKAASLYQILQTFTFIHVQERSEVFLGRFRREFSLMLLKRMLVEHDQGSLFEAAGFIDGAVMGDLYALRCDAEGVGQHRPSSWNRPTPTMQAFAVFIGLLVRQGARVQGRFFVLREHRLRVVNAAGRLLDQLMAEFADEPDLPPRPSITVCVGGINLHTPRHWVRASEEATIVRPGNRGSWMNEQEALVELGIC